MFIFMSMSKVDVGSTTKQRLKQITTCLDWSLYLSFIDTITTRGFFTRQRAKGLLTSSTSTSW